MILSDRDIKESVKAEHLVIDPFNEDAVQPVSVDLTLGGKIRIFRQDRYAFINVKQELPDLTDLETFDNMTPFYLHPGAFALGITRERVELPDDLMGRLDGKSSLGRLGLLVHSTAGFIDPGFQGRIVLEFSNVSPLPITLFAEMPIAQISFYTLSSPVEHPYGHGKRQSKYQQQDEPTPSRYYMNFTNGKKTAPPERTREYSPEPTALKQWLEDSEFKGDVKALAEALNAQAKTVEDWIYGRYVPNAKNRAKLYTITQLPEFAIGLRELIIKDQ